MHTEEAEESEDDDSEDELIKDPQALSRKLQGKTTKDGHKNTDAYTVKDFTKSCPGVWKICTQRKILSCKNYSKENSETGEYSERGRLPSQ